MVWGLFALRGCGETGSSTPAAKRSGIRSSYGLGCSKKKGVSNTELSLFPILET